MTAAALVQVEKLRVAFESSALFRTAPAKIAVNDASFEINRGETLGVVGESGSGKTTLGRAILRLIQATSGSVRFDGVDVFAADRRELRQLRRRMQIVFQDPGGSLNPRLRIGAIVSEPLEIHNICDSRQRTARAATLLERVGLSAAFAGRYPHELSGGQKQRVGIARALALEPDFVVLDEPVSALDVSVQAQILALLDQLKREMKLTFLFVAHNLAVVRRLSDRVAVMKDGTIVELDGTEEIFERPKNAYTKALLDAVPDLRPRRAASRRD